MKYNDQLISDELLSSVLRVLYPLMSDSLRWEYDQQVDWSHSLTMPKENVGCLDKLKMRVRDKLSAMIQVPVKQHMQKACLRDIRPRPTGCCGETLVLVPYDVWQLISGGAVRVHEIARRLRQVGNVTVICLGLYSEAVSVKSLAPGVRMIRVPGGNAFRSAASSLKSEFGAISCLVAAAREYILCDDLLFLVQGVKATIGRVVVVGPYWVPMVKERLAGVPVYYDAHDVNADYAGMICGFTGEDDVQRVVNAVRRLEQEACDISKRIWCVSGRDMERMADLYEVAKEKILLLENGVDISTAVYADGSMTQQIKKAIDWPGKAAVFVGSNHHPNREAALFICRYLAPRFPSYLFLIVGMLWKECLGGTQATFVKPANVQFLGKLDHMKKEAVMALSDFALAPMSKGCGASLKIPDYVAHGKKVVATPHAVRGYESLEPWIAKAELDNYCDLFGELIEPGMQAFQKDCQDAYRWVARRLDWGMTCQTVVDSIGRS